MKQKKKRGECKPVLLHQVPDNHVTGKSQHATMEGTSAKETIKTAIKPMEGYPSMPRLFKFQIGDSKDCRLSGSIYELILDGEIFTLSIGAFEFVLKLSNSGVMEVPL